MKSRLRQSSLAVGLLMLIAAAPHDGHGSGKGQDHGLSGKKTEEKIKEGPRNGSASSRPTTWAAPMQVLGVKNFHKVSDLLYRGSQPDREGMKALAAMGIRTVINLRSAHSDRSVAEGTGLDLVEIEFDPFKDPKLGRIRDFLKAATDPDACPCYVHCKHGSDRTGTAVAVYRSVVQGWSKDEAVREMTDGGFGFHAKVYDKVFDYPGWVRKLDVEGMRKKLEGPHE